MKIKSSIKAGGYRWNHNQTIARSLKIKSNIKAGDDRQSWGLWVNNHNQTISRGLKVKSGIKAGDSGGRSYVTGYFQMDLDGLS